ncbi:MAG: transglutaminase domain-containing protein, partial [Oscillospiraceae bacterium]|nr:transglutaminase domain-containing protein [Oscillospiraceae bacterium]
MKSSLNYSDRQENLSNNGKKISDEVLTDYLCCWLIVIGVLLIMKQLFRFENPIHMIIIRSGIVLSITALLTRFRRYTIFIIPAVLLYAVFLLWATDNLASFFEYITGIIEWWVDLFPSHSYYNTPFNVSLVLWIISAFVCLIVVILVRRIHIFGVIAALIALLVFVVLVNGFRNNLLGISFISIGIFPLLIRSNYIKLELHLDDLHFSRRRVMFSGLAICLIFALASNLIVPQDTSKWVNPALSGLYYRIKYSQSFFSKGPFSLQSSGLQPNVDRLGGNVSLNHTLILKVKTDIQVPLKCNVYSLYTGKGWESVSVDEYPLNDFDNELFKDAFDLDMPIDKNGSNPLKNAMHDAETEITMVYGGYSVFSSGRLSSLISADKQAEFMFNSKSEIFSKKLLPTAFTYSYQSTILNKQTNNIAKRIDNIEISSEDDKYDTIKQLYLQLPPELPEPVYIKAREATENSLSDYEKMVELERYLKTNYEYTLKPGNPPKDEDFVNSFLVNGRGYCTYFASAMAVMARTLGVPSRFVIGYGTVPSGNDYASYSDNAHAWVECYFRGVGWIPFDPTVEPNIPLQFRLLRGIKLRAPVPKTQVILKPQQKRPIPKHQ